jgi:MFS family permease
MSNTPSEMTSKRSFGFLLGVTILMLGTNFVWTSYNNILLPTLVEKVATTNRALIVGLIGFFGTMIGITVSLIAGIISDRVSSRWGKRTPAILIGSIIGLPVIAITAIFYPPAIPVIVIGFCGMQFMTNIANGAWWPLLVDVIPEKQRGLASGLTSAFTLVGATLGIVVLTILNQDGYTALALWIVAIVLAICGVITSIAIHGKDKPAPKTDAHFSLIQAFKEIFHVRTRVMVFFWVVLAALLANMGMNSLQFFARYFFETFFPTTNPDYAFRLMGGISLVCTMVSAFGAGVLSDKIGRRNLIMISMFISAVSTVLMGFVTNFTTFLIISAIRSASTGPIVAVIPALASDLTPKDEAGQYMAYNNLSTGLSGALASLVFGVLLTNLSKAGFQVLFYVSAALFVIGGFLFLFKVQQKELDARLSK